jgi:hypothetical protein
MPVTATPIAAIVYAFLLPQRLVFILSLFSGDLISFRLVLLSPSLTPTMSKPGASPGPVGDFWLMLLNACITPALVFSLAFFLLIVSTGLITLYLFHHPIAILILFSFVLIIIYCLSHVFSLLFVRMK